MTIEYFGHSCFRLEGSKSVLFDPYTGVGYEMNNTSADIVVCSHFHFDHHATDKVVYSHLVDVPASRNFDGVEISGVSTFHDSMGGTKRGNNTVFKVKIDGVTVVHLGDIGFIDEKVVSFAKGCDVLFVPVGGFYTIDEIDAKTIADKIAPRVIVPMHYRVKTCNLPIAPVSAFTELYDDFNRCGSKCEYESLVDGVNVFDF